MKEEPNKKKSQKHNRGSLGLFLDVAVDEQLYGQAANIPSKPLKYTGSAPIFGTPSTQRPQSSKAYLQSSGHSPASAWSNSVNSHHHSQSGHHHHHSQSGHHHHAAKPLHAKVVNGHLHIDSTRLKEECMRGFEDKWFCRDDDRYNKNQLKKADLFEVDKELLIPMIISRPQTADSAPSSRRESFSVPPNHQNIDQFSMKPRSIDGLHVAGVAGSIAGSSIQHSVLGNHSVHSSYHAATNRDTASVAEMLGDYEASVLSTPPVRFVEHGEVQGFTHSMNHSNTFNPYNNHNNHNYTLSSELPNNNNRPNIPSLSAVNHGPKKRLNRPSSAPPMKILSQSHLLQQRILSKQTTNLQRLSKSKDGLDRLNNPHKTISADYVLFLECLKNDIFPYYDNQLLDGSQTDHDLVEEDDEHGHISFVEHHTQLTDDQLQPVPSSSTGIALSRQSTNTGLLASQSTYQMDQSHRSQGNRVRHRGPNIHYNSFLASEQLQVRNSHIITLDLGNQGIGVDKGMCLSQALTYCSQLEICNLSNNRLSDKAIHAILQTLCMLDDKPSLDPAVDKKYSMLRYLDLSNNEAGKQSAALLAEFLKHCSDDSTASDDIDLTLGRALDNSLTLDGDSHWLQTSSIISHTATNKMMRICQLEYLNLSYCNLGDEWSCWIAKGMKHADCCVRELQMVSNRIGAEESNHSLAWSELITANTPLKVLNLSFNFLRRHAASLLLHGLGHNNHLISLNVSNNQISDYDVIQSISKIEHNSILQHLDLSCNQLTNVGCIAAAFSASQLTCTSLNILDISGNRMGYIAYQYIVERVLHVLRCNQEMYDLLAPTSTSFSQSCYRVLQIIANPLPHMDHGIQPTQSTTIHRIYGEKSYANLNSSSSGQSKAKSSQKKSTTAAATAADSTPLQFFNPYNISNQTFTFDLSNPYEHINARMVIDAIEQNALACSFLPAPNATLPKSSNDTPEEEEEVPANITTTAAKDKNKAKPKVIRYGSSNVSIKWYNTVMKSTEYITATRSIEASKQYYQLVLNQLMSIPKDEDKLFDHPQLCPITFVASGTKDNSAYQATGQEVMTLLQQFIDAQHEPLPVNKLSLINPTSKKLLIAIGMKLGFVFADDILTFLFEKWDEWLLVNDHISTAEITQMYLAVQAHPPATASSSSKTATGPPHKLKKQRSVYADLELDDESDDKRNQPKKRNAHEIALLSDPLVVLKFILAAIYDFLVSDRHESSNVHSPEGGVQTRELNIHRLYAHRQLLHRIVHTNSQLSSTNPIKPSNNNPPGAMNTEGIKVDDVYEQLVRFISELSFEYNHSNVLHHHLPTNIDQELDTQNQSNDKKDNPTTDEGVTKFFTVSPQQFYTYILQSLSIHSVRHLPSYSLQLNCTSNSTSLRTDLPTFGTLTIDNLYLPPILAHSKVIGTDSNNHASAAACGDHGTSARFSAFMRMYMCNLKQWDRLHVLYYPPATKANNSNENTGMSGEVFHDSRMLLQSLQQILSLPMPNSQGADVSNSQIIHRQILHLTCEEAEEIYKCLYSHKTSYHLAIIQGLLWQLANPYEVKRFLQRNCYVHEIVLLKKKLSYLLDILLGRVAGHYVLDLLNPLHRSTVSCLLAFHNSKLTQVRQHLQSHLPPPVHSSIPQKSLPKSNSNSIGIFGFEQCDNMYFRNATFDEQYIEITSHWLAEELPSRGRLRFDYVDISVTEPSNTFLRSALSSIPTASSRLLTQSCLSQLYSSLYNQLFVQQQKLSLHPILHYQTISNTASATGGVSIYNGVYKQCYEYALLAYRHTHTNNFPQPTITATATSTSAMGPVVEAAIPDGKRSPSHGGAHKPPAGSLHKSISAPVLAPLPTNHHQTSTAPSHGHHHGHHHNHHAQESHNDQHSLIKIPHSILPAQNIAWSTYQNMLVKQEQYSDLLIAQCLGDKQVYTQSSKLTKQLKLSPKNLCILHASSINNGSSGRNKGKRSSSTDVNGKKGSVLNIMLKNYPTPTTTNSGGIGNKNKSSKSKKNKNKNVMESHAEGVQEDDYDDFALRNGSDDEEEDEEDEEESYEDLSQWNRENIREKILQDIKAARLQKQHAGNSGENPRNLRMISKESFFKLQDLTNNLDTGSRAAFVLQNHTLVPNDNNGLNATSSKTTVGMTSNGKPGTPKAGSMAAVATQTVNGFGQVVNIQQQYESQMRLQYQDLLQTCYQAYWHWYQDGMNKQCQQLFADIVKQLAQHHQYHFTSDKEAYPDEFFQSDEYNRLKSKKMHEFLRFQILNHPNFPGGGDNQGGTTKASMMKKTAKKSSMSVLHRTTISPMTSGGTRHHAYAVLTQADLETSLTSAMNMDMSLLLLEVCLMYHNMLDSRQVEIILESFKDQKATNEILLRAITIMLPYVIDVDHFANMIRKLLGEVQYQECLHRFGYFAMWSPLHPEGKYDLDLLDREHRDVLIIVASLLQQDPTIDAVDCQFQPSPMHAWDSFDINTCALKTLPNSNGLALSPPSTLIRAVNNNAATTEAAAAAASSAKPQKGKDGNATASKPIPIQDLKCGRVTFKIKSKSMDSMLHPAEGEIRSAAWSQLTTPGEIIARQQAARYVFLQYKHALTRHALLYGPAATSASWSTSPTMASTMYNVYPNFK